RHRDPFLPFLGRTALRSATVSGGGGARPSRGLKPSLPARAYPRASRRGRSALPPPGDRCETRWCASHLTPPPPRSLSPHSAPAAALAPVPRSAVPSAESAPASRATTPAATLRLVPEPMQLELGAGIFALDQRLSIAVPSGDAEDLFAAGLLAAEIRAAGGAD